MEAFARDVAARTRASERHGLYARIFWSLGEECDCHLIERAADWTFLKQAMRDVYAQYPVTWNGQWFAELSCRMKDVDEGRRYIRAIHPDAPNEHSFAALFAACDYEARTNR